MPYLERDGWEMETWSGGGEGRGGGGDGRRGSDSGICWYDGWRVTLPLVGATLPANGEQVLNSSYFLVLARY